MNTFIGQYDKWIAQEAYRFVSTHKGAGDVDDYIQTAREAALRICKRKGYTADNLTALIMGDIRMAIFNALYTAYSKRDGIGLNAHTLKNRPVRIDSTRLPKHCRVSTAEDEDNSLLWSLKAMVNEEWGQILQEIANGYTQTEISQMHGISPQLLHYHLRRIGEVMKYGGCLSRGVRRIS